MPSSSYFCSLKSAMTWSGRTRRQKGVCLFFSFFASKMFPEPQLYSQSLSITDHFSSLAVASGSAYLSDDLSHILYHHLICCYGLHRKQAPVVDVTSAEADFLLAELEWEDVSGLMFSKAMFPPKERTVLLYSLCRHITFPYLWFNSQLYWPS